MKNINKKLYQGWYKHRSISFEYNRWELSEPYALVLLRYSKSRNNVFRRNKMLDTKVLESNGREKIPLKSSMVELVPEIWAKILVVTENKKEVVRSEVTSGF